MKSSSKDNKLPKYRAQAMVEFAIVLPILLALLIGIFEVGRMVFIYAAVTNASREAVRYASAIGREDTYGYEKYRYCAGIEERAERSAFMIPSPTITIMYDNGPGTSSFGPCNYPTGEDPDISVDTGDRVTVTVQADYEPMLALIPISSRTFTSSSARTILGIFELDNSGSVATSTSSGPMPSSTSTTIAPSDTPTPTATVPSPTPTETVPVVLVTFTPLPTNTQTLVPTFSPTATSTVTTTPTITSTSVTGCGNITRGTISIPGASGNKSMSMTITNPNSYSVTVSSVQVTWNSATGGPGSSLLTLQTATLGSVFWTGSSSTGTLTITPSTTLTIPGNNTTSTIIFGFDKNYQTTGSPSITINLSTPGCESNPIKRP